MKNNEGSDAHSVTTDQSLIRAFLFGSTLLCFAPSYAAHSAQYDCALRGLADNGIPGQTSPTMNDAVPAAAQALLTDVEPQLAFEQGDLIMFVMDVPPDVPPQYAPIVVAENGSFSVTDTLSSSFGWESRGQVVFNGNEVQIAEDNRAMSGLTQTFIKPEGIKALRFTLTGVDFGTDSSEPPDAFEVALLDAITGQVMGLV